MNAQNRHLASFRKRAIWQPADLIGKYPILAHCSHRFSATRFAQLGPYMRGRWLPTASYVIVMKRIVAHGFLDKYNLSRK
jgi:hypothetical protein